MIGYIHSKESFGTVDGPGIRYVIFMQGCPLRCLYCHNPDTWAFDKGNPITPEEIIAEYNKNRPFYSKGGITVTGGEPLMQIDFVTSLFRLAKRENIHTCLDTSGAVFNGDNTEKIDALLDVTDLVLLDIKHIETDAHKKLTGIGNKNILQFAEHLEKRNIPVWVRHVVVKGITDNPEDLFNLGRFIGKLKNLKALDVLPYHTMGVSKYEQIGIKYPLEGVKPLSNIDAEAAKKHILKGIMHVRKQ